MSSLYVESNPTTSYDKWMTIVSWYIILVSLSMLQIWTFFLLMSPTPSVAHQHLIAIEFVNGNHFVHVYIIYLRDFLVL